MRSGAGRLPFVFHALAREFNKVLGKADKAKLNAARAALLEKIGYQFNNTELLTEALTHPSVNDGNDKTSNNQRLEFLGDRVIGLIMADTLFGSIKQEREGNLTRRYADCVENSRLASIARDLDLGASLETTPNTDDAKTDKVLADALEALMGAIWRDGGMQAVRPVILSIWSDVLADGASSRKDSKSRLQELAMEKKWPMPNYKLVERTGPDHSPVFLIAVTFNGHVEEASGSSKRQAEQEAATKMLEQMT